MIRYFSTILAAAALSTAGLAQDIVPVNHGSHPHALPAIADGGVCATGTCGTCTDCVRIADVKKTQVPVYSCKIKEICIPNCSILGHLFGNAGDCKKIEVRQLVKKYRTDEECITKCVTADEAAKHYEAEAKKAAAKAKEQSAPPAAKTPAGPVSNEAEPAAPVAMSWSQRLIPSGLFAARKN